MWERLVTQNGFGGEAIIWLIIAFFWVVAQVVAKAKEARLKRTIADDEEQPAPDAPPEAKERGFERQMREFFEQLGVEEVEEKAAPPSPPRPPAPPPRPSQRATRARPARPARVPVAAQPPPRPQVTLDAPTPPVQETQLGDIDTTLDESALDTEQAYALREWRSENMNAFVNPRTLLVNLNYLRMNMPIVPIRGLESTDETRPRPRLTGRQALRESITNQIILSNPLAMGEDKSSYTKRIV